MNLLTAEMTDPEAIRRFVLAGQAVITLQSERTTHHFTYQVRKSDDSDVWFVSVLTGTDFGYIGLLRENGIALQHTRKSKVAADSLSFRGFEFFWRHIATRRLPPQMKVRHEGRCGRCGRPLTHPRSIDLGIGPECAGKMGY